MTQVVNWTLLQNSLLMAGFTTAFAVSLGLIAAVFVAGLERRWQLLCIGASVAAFALPPFLVTNCWMRWFGLTGIARNWIPFDLYSLGGAIVILGGMLWPLTLLLTLASWSRLDRSLLDSEPGLAGFGLARMLLLPAARSNIQQSAVITFVLALNNFAVPSLLQVKVFSAEVFVYFNTKFDTAGALFMSWPLIVAPLLLLLLLHKAEFSWQRAEGSVPPAVFRRRTGRLLNCTAGGLTVALMLLSLVLPMFDLLFDRRTWVELGPALNAGWPAILNSGIVAAITAGIVAVAGLFGWRWRIGGWLWLPYLVPGVLMAIGLVHLLNRPGLDWLYRSIGVIVLAWTIRYLAPGWNLVARAMKSRDADLNDAARLEGASPLQEFRAANWPQIGPQLLAAAYVTYLFCLWDVETLSILQPPGSETLASRVFGFLHYGHNAQVNALCLILIVLAVAPLVLYAGVLAARSGRGPGRGGFVEIALSKSATSSRQWPRITGVFFSLLAASLVGLVATGCSRQTADHVAIHSKLFTGVQIIGSRGGGLGQFNKPRSLAVDSKDNLYVVDMTGRVQKFSSGGVFLSYWQMPETDKGKPKGMCRDHDGNIVVLEPHYSRVNHYRPDGSLAMQWGTHGTNAGELAFPRSVAVNSRGEVFASEYGLTERVQQFSADGKKLIRSIGHAGGGAGEFNRPEGLGIDAQDRLFVADSCNHRVEVFSTSGEFVRAHGSAGSARGEMSYPYDVRVDAEGRQYVCEFGNSRIQIFDANDQPIEIIGGVGADPGQFNNPWGLALDSKGNLYVADSMNHRVQKFIRREKVSARGGSVVRRQWSVAHNGQRTTDNGRK